MSIMFQHPHRWGPGCLVLVLLIFIGCGPRDIYPVEGRIVDLEGNPITELKGGVVEFDSVDGQVSASGDIQDDASFRMTTNRRGDGAWLGKNRVLIARRYLDPETPAPRVIPEKYEKYETSGLEVIVEPKNNVVELKVQRLRPRKPNP